MTQELLATVRRYTEAHADASGIVRAPMPGMTLVRTTGVGQLQYGIQRPLICLVVQGAKEVAMGGVALAFKAGDTMLISADVPTVSQITRASRAAPYLSFALYLDPALIVDLSVEMKTPQGDGGAPVQLFPTDDEVADTAVRMVRLLDRPAALPVLHQQLLREMHYWLLAGRHGPAIRHLGLPDSHARRIARAVELIRSEFASHLPVERLAAMAGMSPSTFHHHFRAVTSLSPIQFQKQLRLIKARRMMLADGAGTSTAAYMVGYESVPQFTRDYGRPSAFRPCRRRSLLADERTRRPDRHCRRSPRLLIASSGRRRHGGYQNGDAGAERWILGAVL